IATTGEAWSSSTRMVRPFGRTSFETFDVCIGPTTSSPKDTILSRRVQSGRNEGGPRRDRRGPRRCQRGGDAAPGEGEPAGAPAGEPDGTGWEPGAGGLGAARVGP